MSTVAVQPKAKKRIHWMDNLRTIIILFVMIYHIGGVYEVAGLWGEFWIVDEPATIVWSGIVGIVFDVFVMPAIFFISGYLTPLSLQTKSGKEFIIGKAKRLLLPWLVAVLTLIPLYKVIFLYSRGLPQQNWTTYFHPTNPNSQNWLWFLPVLFVFNLIYLLIEKFDLRLEKIKLGWAIAGTVVIGILVSYLVGLVWGFRSWTLTPLIDFENERIFVYLLTFLIGVIAYKRDIFANLPKKQTLYTIASSVAWLPLTGHIFVRLTPFLTPDPAAFIPGPGYRWLWWITLHLSTLVMVYTMVETFWRYVDKDNSIWRELNRNSYGVYIIHVIVLGIFATLFLGVGIPPELKYVLVIILTYLFSNLLVSGGRRAWAAIRKKPTTMAPAS